MASKPPPPVSPKQHSKSDRAPIPRAPTRSYRRSQNGSASTGTDVAHVIRVTVLGLAGVTVNPSSCRDASNKSAGTLIKSLPPPPTKMRAIVAFSRRGQIHGTTTLSKPLSSSPKNQTGEENIDEDASRHVAVWTAGENTVGSEVAFEAGLHRADNFSSSRSTASSAAFAPKSFDVTVALTEDSDADSKIAIPLGIANLAVAGDESADGKCVTLDLPVMSLEDAQPVAEDAGKSAPVKYPLISIQKKIDSDDKKKSPSLKKRFFKNKTPSALDRKAFQAAYCMDPSGDAVLRVKLEVYDKAKEDLFNVLRRGRNSNATKSGSIRSARSASDESATPADEGKKPLVGEASSVEHPGDEISAINEKLKRVAVERIANEERARDEMEWSPAIQEEESHTGSFLPEEDDTWADDEDSYFSLDENTMKTDDYTLSFTPKAAAVNGETQDNAEATSGNDRFRDYLETSDGELYLKMFGRKVRIPSCRGPLPDEFEVDDNGTARVTLDAFGRHFRVPVCRAMVPPSETFDDGDTFTTRSSRWQDELTMVSAKVFGRKVCVPMPREFMAGRDNDTVTTMTRQEPRSRSQRMLDQAQRTLGSFMGESFRYGGEEARTFDESSIDDSTAGYGNDSVESLIHNATEMSMEIEELLGNYEANEIAKAVEPPVSPSTTRSVSKKKVGSKKAKKSKRTNRSSKQDSKREVPKRQEVVEIDQDRAPSEEDLSIYKLGKSGPMESASAGTWGHAPQKTGEMLVEIDQDRAESLSIPAINKANTPKLAIPAGMKKTKSSSSPQGVADVDELYSPPARGMDAFLNEFPEAGSANFAQSFADFLTCQANAMTVGHVTYEEPHKEVPPLIIPRDDASIGDLTANTHEQHIAWRNNMATTKKSNDNGVDRTASNSSWGFSHDENYFSEYGEESSLRPANGQQMQVPTPEAPLSSSQHQGWLKPCRKETTSEKIKKSKKSLSCITKTKRTTESTPVKTSPGRYFSSEGEQEVTVAGIEQDLEREFELEIPDTAVAI